MENQLVYVGFFNLKEIETLENFDSDLASERERERKMRLN